MEKLDISLVLGAFATMIAGFYGITKIMLSQGSKDRESDRKEREADRQERLELSKAIQDMAGATGRVADASVKAATEAELRNGHLAELSMQGNKLICEVIENTKDINSKMDESAVKLKTNDKARKRAVRMVKTGLEVE